MSSENPLRLSIVIPVYNESRIINETLRRVHSFLVFKGEPGEIIVSNDGSTDRTADIVREFIQAHPLCIVKLIDMRQNSGKGAAVRKGVLAAEGRAVLITDADLSTPVKESDKLVQAIEAGCDIAIGSRALREPGVDVQQSFKRRLSGRIFNFFVKLIVTGGYQDTQCGFKCFTRQAARVLFKDSRVDGFSFDVEILYLAGKRGFRVREVPVMWRQGRRSSVSLLRDSVGMLRDLFRIRLGLI